MEAETRRIHILARQLAAGEKGFANIQFDLPDNWALLLQVLPLMSATRALPGRPTRSCMRAR
jgi:hypothetical protein